MPARVAIHTCQQPRCRACGVRRARAAAGAAWRTRWDVWLPGEDRRLRELAGLLDWAQLATHLAAEFGVRRTPQAVRHRASRLGIRGRPHHLSLADLERLFGVDGQTVLRRWVGSGALRVLDTGDGGGPMRWRFRETDVEEFIRAWPWLYDWTRLQSGHRLRSLAEVMARSDPWLTLPEAAARTGLSLKQLRRLVALEQLPHERRWHGSGPWGQIVLRAADVDSLAPRQRSGPIETMV